MTRPIRSWPRGSCVALSSLALFLLTVVAGTASGQVRGSARPDKAEALPISVEELMRRPWVDERDGLLVGGNASYAVCFRGTGVDFGARATDRGQAPLTLRWALQSVGRSGAAAQRSVASIADDALEVDGLTVRYPRKGFTERYDLRAAGVEQSFVFDALPPGEGDLVVRVRLETDLAPSAVDAEVEQLRFDARERGHITIGYVTGIDADGVRARGSMRFTDGHLDLILPADFVDRAALPLVLDPLIGAAAAPTPSFNWDVAYGAAEDEYLFVYPGYSYYLLFYIETVVAQRVSSSGALVGLPVTVSNGFSFAYTDAPRVAHVRGRGTFVVTYLEQPHRSGMLPFANTVDAATGRAGRPISLSWTVAELGSSSSPTGNAAIAVSDPADFYASGEVRAQQLVVGPSGGLTTGNEVTLATTPVGGTLGQPSISRSGGAVDRYLVAWDQVVGFEQNLYGAFVDGNLAILDRGPLGITPTAKTNASVDGDGERFLVAYETVTPSPFSDIRCFSVFWDPVRRRGYLGPDVVLAGDPTVIASNPFVAWTGGSYLVAYRTRPSAFALSDVTLQSVDPYTCVPCEGSFALGQGGPPRIASQRHGDPAAGDLAVVGGVTSGSPTFRADDGLLADLGGGCGSGGRADASCAITGNATFALRVRGASALAPTTLLLGLGRLDAPCGSCVIVPDPATGVVIAVGSTNGFGNAELTVPLPAVASLVGARLLEQWVTASGGACLSALDLSNALQVEIQ